MSRRRLLRSSAEPPITIHDTLALRIVRPLGKKAAGKVEGTRGTRVEGTQISNSSSFCMSINVDSNLLIAVCTVVPLIFVEGDNQVIWAVVSSTCS